MSWAPLLLVLSALCSCSFAQYTLTPGVPSVSVAPGGAVTLSCTVSGLPSLESKYPAWYQQKEGKAPVLLVYSNGASASHANNRPAGIPARFSGSCSGTTMSLTISAVQAGDDGDFICQIHHWEGSTLHCIFGGGTQLNVLTGETQAPSLSIFPPSQEEVEKNKATVVCLAQDFYPASLDVTWMINGQTVTNGVEKSRVTKQIENNLFMGSSYLFMTPEDWSTEKTVTCQVTHQGKTFSKSVKKSECV